MYDEALAMNNYSLKDPTPYGRDFITRKFNEEFNMNVSYKFFKEKLDNFKKKYKKWKALMKTSTGISVDPTTSMISASEQWWKDHEAVINYNLSYYQKYLFN